MALVPSISGSASVDERADAGSPVHDPVDHVVALGGLDPSDRQRRQGGLDRLPLLRRERWRVRADAGEVSIVVNRG